MSLDFLGGTTQLATGIGGLLNAFGVGRPKMNYGPTPSEAQANSLYQALLDPNNSLVKQNTDANKIEGMQNLLMQLKQMQLQSARGQARGLRPSFFAPERADETINYLTTRGQPAIARQARTDAMNTIRGVADNLMKFVPDERDMMNARNTNAGVNASNFQLQGGYGGVANEFGTGLQDLLTQLLGSTQRRPNNNFIGPMPYQSGLLGDLL